MLRTSDRVPLTHPDLPGQIIHVRPPGVPARVKRGWIPPVGWTDPSKPSRKAAKSPTKPVDEPQSPEGDNPTPSEEEES